MRFEHLPDGRTIADTAVMAALTARPAAAIRRHCRRSPDGYDIAECETILATAPDPLLLTARQAEQYLGIPAGTVRSWACRVPQTGLRALDFTPEGRPMYDIGDLLKLRQGDPA